MTFDGAQTVGCASVEAKGDLSAGLFFRYDPETEDIDDLPRRNVGSSFKYTAVGALVSFRLDGVTHVYHLPGAYWYL